jgi:hypothetical protein
VGKAIEVDAPEGTLVTEDPRRATILSAAKITGKTRSGLSIGVLEAMTQEEEFTYRDSSNNTMSEVVEPFSNFSLVRLKQDLWENSNIGMIATSVAGESRSPAYTGGLDWNLKFIDAMYTIDGFYAHSRTINKNSGAPREGSAGRIRIGKVGGGHWIYNISSDFTSRQYYINDIGYFRSPNDYGVTSQAEYREYQPGDVLRSYEIGAGVHWRSNFEQVVLNRNIQLESSAQLLNYYLMWIGLNQSFPADDDKESRGLGLYRTPMKYSAEIGFETDDREMVFGGLEQGFTYDLAGQRTWQTGAMIVVRPTSAIDLEFGVDYSRVRNDVAFATRYDDTLAIQKTIAIFGHRDVDEFDLTFRGSLVFSENLTLQVYSQFFAAKYRYDNFSYLESDSRLIAYPYSGSKNSNRTALNTSVVLRWEYLPGSTMYAVWTHGREFFEREGFGRSFPEELDNTFDVPPDNVFMLKISYWFSL